jgi:L-xylulose reductase
MYRLLLHPNLRKQSFKRLAPVAWSRWQGTQDGGKAVRALACGAAVAFSLTTDRQSASVCEGCTEPIAQTETARTEPTNFTGKVAVVTGAANGLGLQIARRLVLAGAKVALVDRDEKALKKAAAELGENVQVVACDLRNVESTRKTMQAAGLVGSVDFLVNCAGIAIFKSFFEISQEVWDCTMDVNARAILFLSQLLIPGMVARGGGSIVNVSSQSSTVVVGPKHTCYSTSKAAVDHITRSTAINLADKNIRCNAVCPTVVRTELAIKAHGEEGLAAMAAKIPLQRICLPDDVADVVLFLLSDHASMVTGVTLPIDGGFLASR